MITPPISLGALPDASATPISPAPVEGAGSKAAKAGAVDPQVLQAARDFEAIFVRQLLSSLEKTTHLGGDGPMTSGGGMYSSMVVGAMADSVASGGGLGLADIVARALSAEVAE